MESTDFGKSHVIPESFFLHRKVQGETAILTTNKKGVHPKKRPIGEYDTEILCKKCEKEFNAWDSYGKELLINKYSDFKTIEENGSTLGYYIESFDYVKLKMFFISVLWRASVSKRDLYKKVALGPHENILREMVTEANPGSKDNYDVQLFRFSGVDYPIPILMPVEIRSSYGLRYYRVYLGDHFYDIKVDKQKTPKNHNLGIIEKTGKLWIPTVNFRESQEYEIIKAVANAPTNKNI
ncbi:MAG: hypothetical protein OEY89_13145 [Gammaproteobacteria bacterium]|nr:hypothetical protein [Gammaproteobacteria bacterium]